MKSPALNCRPLSPSNGMNPATKNAGSKYKKELTNTIQLRLNYLSVNSTGMPSHWRSANVFSSTSMAQLLGQLRHGSTIIIMDCRMGGCTGWQLYLSCKARD